MAGLREIIIQQSQRDNARFASLSSSVQEALELEASAIVLRVEAQHGWWHSVEASADKKQRAA